MVDRVIASVEDRLAGLSESAKEVLNAASVIGSPADPEMLLKIVDLCPEDTRSAIAELQRLELIRKSGTSFDFQFDLELQRLVREQLPTPVRASFHRRIALILESMSPELASPQGILDHREAPNGVSPNRSYGNTIVRLPNESGWLFRREGDFWTIGCFGRVAYLRDTKGLAIIAYLRQHPGREFYCADLAAMVDHVSDAYSEHAESRVTGSDSGPALDISAKRAYRDRLEELRDELRDARLHGDLERASTLEEEIVFVSRELAHAVGLYGHDRKLGSEAERSRLRVTNNIRYAIAKILANNPQLGRYLRNRITTGTFCSYTPELGGIVPSQF